MTTGNTAIAYLKNDEDESIVITGLALGVSTGSFTDVMDITLVRNPTTGSIVNNAVAPDMFQNRNFGSSALFTNVTEYKGADGDTFTDGADIATFFQNGTGRFFANLGWEVPKGKSIGVRINPHGTTEVYCALIGHLKDPKEEA